MENQKITLEGTIVSAKNGRTKYSEDIKNRINLKVDELPYELLDEAYSTSGSKLTPKWLKERTGYINLASKYDIPLKAKNGRQMTFDEFLNTPTVLGSTIRINVMVKEGSVYPMAFIVLEDGEASDPFEGL